MSATLSSMERRRMMKMSELVTVFTGKAIQKRFAPDKYSGEAERGYDASGQSQDIILHQFDSVAEELVYARAAIEAGYNPYNGGESVADQPHDKIGRSDLKTWEDAFTAASERWEEGNKIFHKCMTEVENEALPTPKSNRRRPIFSPWEGDEIDRDRLYSGQDYWRGTSKRLLTQSNTICVIVNSSSPWNRQGKEIMWRGVAGTLITDKLEEAGYRCELWSGRLGTDVNYETKSGNDVDVYQSTMLKEASQPLNWPIMINAMTGWYYRCVAWVSFYHKGYTSHSNLGYPIHNIEPWMSSVLLRKDLDPTKTMLEQGIVVVEDFWDRETALKKVTEILRQFTGEELYAV